MCFLGECEASGVHSAAVGRLNTAAKAAPIRFHGRRSALWECVELLTASSLLCRGPTTPRSLACLMLAPLLVLLRVPCAAARHRDRMAFALAITPEHLLFTEDPAGSCGTFRTGRPPVVRIRMADVLGVQRYSACLACGSVVEVFLADEHTGQRRVAQTCCGECHAGADAAFFCTEDPEGLEDVLNQVACSGGEKGEESGGGGGGGAGLGGEEW